LVVWPASLIAVYKSTSHSNFPISDPGRALDHLFDTLPNQAYLELIVETEEVHHALKGCVDIVRYKKQANVMISVPEWQRFMGIW
jgi:hypothetical protein